MWTRGPNLFVVGAAEEAGCGLWDDCSVLCRAVVC